MDPRSRLAGRFPVAPAALLVILVSALIRAAGAAQPGPEPLFIDDAAAPDGTEAAAPPDALRGRRVRIDWPRLTADGGAAAAERVALNLFPDLTLMAVRGAIPASAAADGSSWIGAIDGEPVSYVNLTRVGAALSGLVKAGARTFEVLPRAGGAHLV